MEPLNNTNQVKMLLLMLFNSVFVLVFSYILFNIVINPNNYFIEMDYFNWKSHVIRYINSN